MYVDIVISNIFHLNKHFFFFSFLFSLSLAGCGQLELGVPYWATSVDHC